MFKIFRKVKSETNLNWLQTDVHSHILPYIDGNMLNTEKSLKIIKRLSYLGISNLYLTPHFCNPSYHHSNVHVKENFKNLRSLVDAEEIYANIHLGGEYMASSEFEHNYQTGNVRAIANSHILLEMPKKDISTYIDTYLFALHANEYKTIIAHPERYPFCWTDLNLYKSYKNKGCLFQMDILSPSGYYGPEVKKAARYLLKERMVDFVGTNIHNMEELAAVENYVLSGEAHRAFRDNPIQNSKLSSRIYA